MRPVLVVGALTASVSVLVACSRKDSQQHEARAAAMPGVSPAASVPPTPSVSAAPSASAPAETLFVTLESRPTADAAVSSIVARVTGFAAEPVLATVRAPFLCGVVTVRPPGREEPGAHPKREARLTCGDERAVTMRATPGRLVLGDEVFDLPKNASATLPTGVREPEAAPCPDSPASSSPFELKLLRRKGVPEPGEEAFSELALQLPHLQVALMRMLNVPISCKSSRVFAESRKMDVHCAFGESGTRASLELERAALWVTVVRTGYHRDELRARFGLRLSCDQNPRLREFSLRDPGFKPYDSPCANRCLASAESCEDACYARFADGAGTLPSAGMDCIEACQTARAACEARCQRAK